MSDADEVRTVLAVTDLGPAGALAIAVAARRAQLAGAALVVVHAIPPQALVRPLFPHWGIDDPVRQAELPVRVRDAVVTQVATAAPEIAPAEVLVESGGGAEVALAIAERCGADLIVVGPTPATGVDAERVVRHAHTPVLIAREGPRRGPIVACTDFSDPALPAVAAAAREARRTGEPLLLAHALEPMPATMIEFAPPVPTTTRHELERRREADRRLAMAAQAHRTDAAPVVVEGPVVGALLAEVERRAARLLVIGTVGRTGITRFLLGSTAEALVRAAPCTTLVVRLDRRRGRA
ncbi:MAG: universal stress protein [Myxococcales bacterium]|nr:universal stress protein [Myxococcales bacterium]